MLFRDLTALYERLEATTKRLEMRAILVELLGAVEAAELPEVLYLSQGSLRPEYEAVELGVADSLAGRALAAASGLPPAEVTAAKNRSGDLGTTAQALLEARTTPLGEPLRVADVYAGLLAIARAQGEGSQEAKIAALAALLGRATPAEGKFLIRFAIGTLRLGVRELTILDALAQKYGGGTKDGRLRIEAAFNVSSDLGLVASALARGGLDALAEIQLEVGRPIRAMLAEREVSLAAILERMDGKAAFEYKYDGLRVQAHIPVDGPAELFSRRLEKLSHQFPELVAELPSAIRDRPAIVEGECVPVDPETGEIRPFQDVSRRRGRKYDLERMQAEVPVNLVLFDVLLAGGAPTIDRPFPERRERLGTLVAPTERIRLATQRLVTTVEDGQAFFDESIAAGCEGIVAKSVAEGSQYRAGARGFWWIKFKRDYTQGLADTVDGVIVGAFHGRGRRGGKFGALLLATYNPEGDRFETFCKVGSGFDDATLDVIPERLRGLTTADRPAGIITEVEPDLWVVPKLVMEVEGAELTLSPNHRAGFGAVRAGAGLALRFPRFTGRWRDDKDPTGATTSAELVEMYNLQVRRGAPADEPDAAA